MASMKRGRPLEYQDRNPPNKRPRPNQPVYNTAAYDQRAPNYAHSNGKPAHRNFQGAGRSDVLSRDNLQTGLVSLLDNFVAATTTSDAEREILRHASELRRLLVARSNPARIQLKRDLDEKRPDKAPRVKIPEYIERKVEAAKALPPLPPIAEPHLHEAVFTHRSANYTPGQPVQPQDIQLDLDYERLELLGDAYIELIASRALYNRFPQVDVPELCSWRERLVENACLGKFSEAYGFPERLKHQSHWDKGSKSWRKVVADMFEAYVAALVLADPANGFEIAEAWLTELWAPQILTFKAKVVENLRAKEDLNKMISLKDIKLDYREEKPMSYDEGSIQRFYVGVYLTGWGYEDEWLGSGEGQNKHQAATAAAAAAIKNSPAVKAAERQKKEIMEARRKAKEEAEKEKAEEEAEAAQAVEGEQAAEGTQDAEITVEVAAAEAEEDVKQPTVKDKDETFVEVKKKKKHKKSKKEVE